MKTILALSLFLFSTCAWAGEADVTAVKVKKASDGTYYIRVTLLHADEGWDHYANVWEVLAPDGTVLATRKLGHPHVDEQPFARSLKGVKIPEDIKQITLRGGDSVHGFGGVEMTVDLD